MKDEIKKKTKKGDMAENKRGKERNEGNRGEWKGKTKEGRKGGGGQKNKWQKREL